jgi:hypothetical protein
MKDMEMDDAHDDLQIMDKTSFEQATAGKTNLTRLHPGQAPNTERQARPKDMGDTSHVDTPRSLLVRMKNKAREKNTAVPPETLAAAQAQPLRQVETPKETFSVRSTSSASSL